MHVHGLGDPKLWVNLVKWAKQRRASGAAHYAGETHRPSSANEGPGCTSNACPSGKPQDFRACCVAQDHSAVDANPPAAKDWASWWYPNAVRNCMISAPGLGTAGVNFGCFRCFFFFAVHGVIEPSPTEPPKVPKNKLWHWEPQQGRGCVANSDFVPLLKTYNTRAKFCGDRQNLCGKFCGQFEARNVQCQMIPTRPPPPPVRHRGKRTILFLIGVRFWGNVCPAHARRATFVSSILSLAQVYPPSRPH